MKLKIVLFTVLFLGFSNSILSQNVLSIETKGITTATEFELAISLENTDEIAAIQFDINYNANEFELLTGHILTSRGINHTLGVNSISEGVVRVVIYSSSNSNIIGNLGSLLALQLKSKNNSGNFPFTLSKIVFSSSSGVAITSTKNDGVITVLGPKMEVQVGQINFGSVLLGSNQTRSLPIRNSGNQPLEITSVNDVFPFSIQESFPISIQPNSTTYLTVSIDASIKFKGSKEISFVNNDPEINRNSQTVNLSADVYAINTIRIGTGSGEINSEVEIPISIENMEDFTGFQFDILLPEGIEYIANSIIETSRFDGHLIGVNLINGNTLRFIGYSSVNKNFKGNSGELFRFKLKPIVNAGYFSLNVSNAILTNIEQENILSNSYSGYIQINTGNLSISPSNINFLDVPVTETRQRIIQLYNYGNAVLKIDEIVNNSSNLKLDTTLPIEIEIGGYQNVNLTFTPSIIGSFLETINFKNNGDGWQNSIVIQSNVFSPNYLMVENQEGYPNETNVFSILLKNNDEVRAVQFDVELPVGFELDVNTIGITDRTSGFEVAASKLSGTIYRIILYSLSNQVINKGDLSIIKLPVVISKDAVLGAYQFNFANVIISDVKNQNVSSSILENGTITIVEKDTDNDGIYDTVDNCIGTYNPNQEDLDGDGIGDACADDLDGDGVMNNVDVCPNTPSGETVDANGCSSSQLDTDGDGIMDSVDVCPNTPSGETVDTNGCSSSQLDNDKDGVMNNVDVCPNTPSGESADTNGCSSSQLDTDGDGIMDNVDVCPNTPSGETADTNGCSSSQLDDDKDGVMDNVDVCSNTPSGETVDANGCSSSQLDTDGDGVMDNVDVCPNTPSGETADTNGCSSSQLDTDGDGVMDNVDLCPNTPSGETADANGCSSGQLDDDNDDDGIKNDVDFCHFTPSGETVDANGCSSSQLDTDGDGIKDNIDNCPTISNVNQSDIDGDLIGDLCDDDKDGDGVLNVDDNSPEIANPNQEDMDGDGIGDVSDTDIDGDGVLNEVDNCPMTSNPNQSDIDGDLIGDDCDTDMDGDGVLNVDDNSPEIANPNQEDLDGDGIGDVSDTDIDGDGVLNDVDNCPTISNVNQSDIDGDGIGDLCDNDMDGDNVNNTIDLCPNTLSGTNVDATGCPIFSLPSSNFTVTAISETCPGKKNGKILITGQASHPYVAAINGANYNFTNNNLTVDKLQPGDYTVCISVTGQTYNQCYVVTIAPGTTVSAKASVSSSKVEITMEQGTAPFNVLVNNEAMYQTNAPVFSIDVKHGDVVQVKTAVDCEGIFSKSIDLFEDFIAYPNPTNGNFEITMPISEKEIAIELFTMQSQLISKRIYQVIAGKVQLNIDAYASGIYYAKVNVDKPIILKIIKQ